ncbi:response regulator [Algoriphagus vanfongensis]|uniref:response regulator n=1 Tax=Algoriphagus vanfongensis TaxID=426371 RepID=UPI00047B0A4E|nr:response regulator [Algoriphagus vanfongensis]
MKEIKSILVVDDDLDDRSFFVEAIGESSPHTKIMQAEDGEIALKLLDTILLNLPDFIFLDLNMPKKNGKSVLKEIKGNQFLQHIPVYIFSTTSDPKDIRESMELGAKSFITKPFALCDWIKQIKSILSLKHNKYPEEN